jgi:glycine cleavage system H protein
MSNVPADLKYTEEHEWVRVDGDVVVVGITDHAQGALGDVVFLDLPEPGRALARGKAFGVVESVKAVSDLYAPIDGEVVAVNEPLVKAPEGVNKDPYGEAWMLKLKPKNASDVAGLLDAAAYTALLAKIAK